MKKILMITLCFCLSAFLPAPVLAGEMAGVTMENSITVAGSDLSLVGMGIRNKLIVRVYVAGLYMSDPALDPEKIINSDSARAVRMHFLYKKVGAGKLREAWTEGFEKNTPEASQDLKKRMDFFVGLFTRDAEKGDEYLFSYTPGIGTTVTLQNQEVATIEGPDFASALMAIWFGDFPADKGLKKSVLKGLKE
jgi:hypothetical protein